MERKIYDANELPEFQTLSVGAKRKYPWFTTLPGQGFRFDDTVTLAGARSQVANVANKVAPDKIPRRFICRVDADNCIWAIRIDTLPLEVREKWRKRQSFPKEAEDISDEQADQMVVGGPHLVESGKGNSDGDEGYVNYKEPPI